MHGSHLPIWYWFWAAYLIGTLTPGISALQLRNQLGIGSYETAFVPVVPATAQGYGQPVA